jgi:hypothetical protein
METEPHFGVEHVIAYIAGQAADAVSRRPGESEQQQIDRAQAASREIMMLQPRDAAEAIIASQCVMLHEVLVDSICRLFRGEQTVTRSNIVTMDRAIGGNLLRLKRYRAKQSDRALSQLPESEAVADDAIVPGADPAQVAGSEANEAWQTAGYNRQTRRAFDRQVRKRMNKAARAAEPAASGGPAVTSIHNEATATASATSAG